jgi:hypothetical protein
MTKRSRRTKNRKNIKPRTKPLTTRFEVTQLAMLGQIAQRERRSVGFLIRDAVADFLKKHF